MSIRPGLDETTLRALLERWPVARLGTASRSGQPHLVPIVFCAHDGVVYSPLDGKRKRPGRLQRFTNLADNPSATLLLDTYDADWQQLWWVRIDGEAQWCEPDEALARAVADRLLNKYPQYRNTELTFNREGYLKFTTTRVSFWSQSGSVTPLRQALDQAGP